MGMTSAPLTLDVALSALGAQPFSALLGTRLTSFGPDGVTLELDIGDRLRQQHGYVHGGVLAYLVDNAITFAAAPAMGLDLVTAGVTVDYLRPAQEGRLRAWASVVQAGRRRAVLRCDVEALAEDGTVFLCAAGQGGVSVRAARA